MITANDPEYEPTPFGKWLKAAMTARSVGVNQLARYAKVSASAISAILSGKTTEPSRSIVGRLAEYFKVEYDYLLDLRSTVSYTHRIPTSVLLAEATGVLLVPVVEQRAGAGEGVQLLEYEYVSPTITAKRNVVAIKVKGDCMAPLINEGDTVVVDREADWTDGRVVLARVDDSLLVKRAYRHNGQVRLHPENPSYGDSYVPDVDIIGVCVRVVKTL